MKKKNELHIYRQGRKKEAHWHYKPLYKGERRSFDLGTHIEVEAQKEAQEIYHSLRGNGWQETLKKYKPDALVVPAGPPITVGEFLASFERVFIGKRTTLTEYGQDFRRVAGDIAELPRLRANDEKHNALLRPG